MALTETDATGTIAGRSTGPRTAEGKARSSMNAVKHGLTARTALLEGEDAQAFREFVWEVVEDLAPVGPVERQLATRVALFMWKRGRLEEAERQVMGELSRRYGGETGGNEGGREDDSEEASAPCGVPTGPADPMKLVRVVFANEFATVKPTQLERLAYYERRIDQQTDSALRTLLRLQYRRQMQGQHGQEQEETEERARLLERLRCKVEMRTEAPRPAGAESTGSRSQPVPTREAPDREAPPTSIVQPPPPAPAQNELSREAIRARQTGPPEPPGDSSRVL